MVNIRGRNGCKLINPTAKVFKKKIQLTQKQLRYILDYNIFSKSKN